MSEADGKRKGLMGRLFGRSQPAAPDPVVAPEPAVTAEPLLAPETPPASAPRPASVPDALPTSPAVPPAKAAIAESKPASSPASAPPKASWFQRLKAGLGKTSSKLSEGIGGLFTKSKLDGATLEDLEDLLIQADLGIAIAGRITAAIGKGRFEKGISADDVRNILAREVERVLQPVARTLDVETGSKPHVIMMVGVNGTGKTTTIGKLATRFKAEGKSVVLAAGDTFRAAAIDQLKVWGERSGCPVVARPVGSDASALAFDALEQARNMGADVLLLDTAGRLQNKQGLMEELEKVTRVLKKIDPSAPHDVILVLDATTGQNALSQVEVFRDRANVTGLVMTKLDGTARGGILVAIADKFALPVYAVGVGEGADDLQPFEAGDYARAIAG